MKTTIIGNVLEVTISGTFDFHAARELVVYCKTQVQIPPTATVRLVIDNVTIFNSCAIGAMLFMSELMPNGIQVQLNKCSVDVHELFESGILDKYFDKARVAPAKNSAKCGTCFEKNCQAPAHECEQSSLPIVSFQPTA